MPTCTLAKHILICDDEEDILEMLSLLLSNAGYAVSTARGHKEFMTKFHEHLPDLILMDVQMPEHDGFWIAERLPGHKRIPIIFITAHDRPVYRLYAPMVGAEDYLSKPFEPRQLLSRLESALQPQKRNSSKRFLDDLNGDET
jgi:DNA-binding response OmpR family regulator